MHGRIAGLFAAIALLALGVGLPTPGHATTVAIVDGSEPGQIVGDFIVAGFDGATGEVGSQQEVFIGNTDGAQTSQTTAMGELVDLLLAAGFSSPQTILVFGFAANETGEDPSLDIQSLTMEFERVDGSVASFSFAPPDLVSVTNFVPGNNGPEAQFRVDLPFDFLAEYDSSSTQDFTLSVEFFESDDGNERFFLDSALTANPPVPEPGTFVLLSLGLAGLTRAGRRAR